MLEEYYEAQALRDEFNEHWVSREDYNDLLDRCESLEEEAKKMEERAKKLDYMIEELDSLENALSNELLKLREGSDSIRRAAGLLEEGIETAVHGE